ncbi:MAG: glutamate synthase [Elusimicrobia bacterium]|nr:glutamate synthase [Elusimicrobiota bacterium]
MAELRPYPLSRLVARARRELAARDCVFDLPRRKFFTGAAGKDLSVSFHGRRASTPFGPAAGPHSQLAQNIALSWLAGARIIELKTVQVKDDLAIPRPCIDMQNVGYNVEWSQELKVSESLDEYVKARMLVAVLRRELALPEALCDTVFDMSVGYDLAGIRSEKVQGFLRGLMDAKPHIDRLRAELPPELRDVEVAPRVSDTLTLSTFHGCPPDEIERILEFLLAEMRLNCIVKLNPTLLGPVELRRVLHDVLGYPREVDVPDAAFEKDTKWEQACGFVSRLSKKAAALGLGFGVKFTNTLIVRNHRDFFPKAEKEMYLSGAPLHALAIRLTARFRAEFGDSVPISFSAGIDRGNFADAVRLGLAPVTVCSDLLKPGGYARAAGYFEELVKAMDAAGAADLASFTAGRLERTKQYAERVLSEGRYAYARNKEVPKKVASTLKLFDCLTCDKCVPVCPNDANFAYDLPRMSIPLTAVRKGPAGWTRLDKGSLALEKKHQLANFADFCNECGNCDVFCPELGGPYVLKPRFFGSLEAWRETRHRDGFFVEQAEGKVRVHGRFDGRAYSMETDGARASYSGEGFRVAFSCADPEGTVSGDALGEVDLTYWRLMDILSKAVLDPRAPNYVNC